MQMSVNAADDSERPPLPQCPQSKTTRPIPAGADCSATAADRHRRCHQTSHIEPPPLNLIETDPFLSPDSPSSAPRSPLDVTAASLVSLSLFFSLSLTPTPP